METRSYKKNRFVIVLVAIAGMSVYLLPYFRYYYYDAYGLTLTSTIYKWEC